MIEYYLKELLEIKNGRDYKHLADGLIPVYGSGGLMRYVNKSLYEDESILLPRKGTLSNIQYVNKPFWTVDTIYYTKVNKEKAVPYYLFQYLKLLNLSQLNSGTGVPSMTFGAYYGIHVRLPKLDIQKQISKVLSDLDAKIELNNKINAELEAMAKLIYDYWFVQFDFPTSAAYAASVGKPQMEGKPYKSSGGKMVYNAELKREIPEWWEVRELGEIVEIQRGISYKSSEIKGDAGIPMINLNSFNLDGTYKSEGLKVFSGKYADKNLIKAGDLLIAVTDVTRNADIIGKAIIVPNYYEELVCSMDIAKIKPTGELSESYLMMLFNSKHYHDYIKWYASGTLVLHLNLNGMNWYKAEIPPNELLKKFETFYVNIAKRIAESTLQNQKLAELRDWLLPMLMNGQVRVGDE